MRGLANRSEGLGAGLAQALSIKVRGWGPAQALSIKVRDWGLGLANRSEGSGFFDLSVVWSGLS